MRLKITRGDYLHFLFTFITFFKLWNLKSIVQKLLWKCFTCVAFYCSKLCVMWYLHCPVNLVTNCCSAQIYFKNTFSLALLTRNFKTTTFILEHICRYQHFCNILRTQSHHKNFLLSEAFYLQYINVKLIWWWKRF